VGEDDQLRVWSLVTGECTQLIQPLTDDNQMVTQCQFGPRGIIVVLGSAVIVKQLTDDDDDDEFVENKSDD